MTEYTSPPGQRVMAVFASGRETLCDVIRIRGGIEFGQVTLRAVIGNSSVIENGSLPRHRVVAGLAVCREVICSMVRILRGMEILDMAGGAIVRHAAEYASVVACRAIGGRVRPDQWKCRMLKPCSPPRDRFVTTIAVLRPALSQVVGVLGPLQVLLMARLAGDRRSLEITNLGSRMATEAGDCRMRSDQGESRTVVERNLALRAPITLIVALFASHAKLTTMVVFVAADTTLSRISSDRPPVIVAPQTLGAPMSA